MPDNVNRPTPPVYPVRRHIFGRHDYIIFDCPFFVMIKSVSSPT